MNKTELVTAIAGKIEGTTKKEVAAFVDAFVETVVETVASGDDVRVSDLGTFKCVEVPERTGKIQMGDRKGETYVTPAHNTPKFKAASGFKNRVAEK